MKEMIIFLTITTIVFLIFNRIGKFNKSYNVKQIFKDEYLKSVKQNKV